MSDLPIFAKWMFDANWLVSVRILQSHYLQKPEGWVTAETEDGEVIGSISGRKIANNLAFGSFFIVHKDWRTRGVGRMLFDEIYDKSDELNLVIDSIESKVDYYIRRGFVHSSFTVSSYIGVPARSMLVAQDDAKSLVKYTPHLFDRLYEYDTKINTIPREGFLRVWLKEDLTLTYCALDGDVVKAYGCIQPVDGGIYRIGPVFADTPKLAQSLFTKLMLSVPDGKQVAFDIPTDNALSLSLVQKHGMENMNNLYRMYTKQVIQFNMENVYAFSTMGIALV